VFGGEYSLEMGRWVRTPVGRLGLYWGKEGGANPRINKQNKEERRANKEKRKRPGASYQKIFASSKYETKTKKPRHDEDFGTFVLSRASKGVKN